MGWDASDCRKYGSTPVRNAPSTITATAILGRMRGLSTLPPLSLYLHLPWCVSKCPYCDFNSHALALAAPGRVRADGALEAQYVDALLRDLEFDLPAIWGRPVVSVFIGGGTPSLFSAAALARLLDGLRARLSFRPGLEITIEANPGSAEYGHLAGYREAGINRISFGAQSFDDQALARLGRVHRAAETELAVTAARQAGFARINIDLMYGLPEQSLDQALTDLDRALALEVDHLSHYQLTLEPNTVFAAKPPHGLPDNEALADIEQASAERIVKAGLARYEISAWAKPGQQCAHNLNYWRFGDYLGLGAGAHGKLTLPAEARIERTVRVKTPRSYMALIGDGADPVQRQAVSADDLPFEFMLNALRLVDGVAVDDFSTRTGLAIDALEPAWTHLIDAGLMVANRGRLAATPRGLAMLNDVLSAFLPARR